MNIALVILHADPARGGAERYTIDTAAALSERGHRVSLLAGSFAATLPGGVSAVPLAAGGATRLGRYRRFLDSLDACLAITPFDVVHAMLPVRHCDVYHPHAGLAAEAVATGPRLSRWGNRLNLRRQHMARIERQLLEPDRAPAATQRSSPSSPLCSPVALCLSNYIKETVRRWYPHLPEDRMVRLLNGVDLQRFDPALRPEAGAELRQRLGLGADAVAALMLAQDFARKGLDTAIRALAQVQDRRVVLVVGGRPDPAAYRRLAESLGVAERVRFVGQADDPYAFYRAADIFVLPTRHDPCSLVVLEALAMGVPVISTRFNGACEAMVSGQHGFVLDDPSDAAALAAAMGRLCDPQFRRSASVACLAARPHLSHAAHIDRLDAVYNSLRGQGLQ